MSETRTEGTAEIYRFGADLSCTRMVDGITIANSITWSPDDTAMYYSCSWAKTIFASEFDLAEGAIRNTRVLARFGEKDGGPDGATVDAEGCLWVANDHAGRITRYTPSGKIDRAIAMPVPRATSVTFGGRNLDTLYVTSARIGVSEEQISAAPLSGSLFALNVGVKGLPEPAFTG